LIHWFSRKEDNIGWIQVFSFAKGLLNKCNSLSAGDKQAGCHIICLGNLSDPWISVQGAIENAIVAIVGSFCPNFWIRISLSDSETRDTVTHHLQSKISYVSLKVSGNSIFLDGQEGFGTCIKAKGQESRAGRGAQNQNSKKQHSTSTVPTCDHCATPSSSKCLGALHGDCAPLSVG
jgi:hypothetical protein